MATINYSAAEINALLAAAGTAAQPAQVQQAAEAAVDAKVGDLSDLETSEKGTVVGAVNENFTSASEGKAAIAAALTGKGQTADSTESFASLAGKIGNLQPAGYIDPAGCMQRMVTNDDAITPTGSYATSTYYNAEYGVQVGYCPDGSVLISMKGGTSTAYENLNFTLSSAPSGVILETSSTSWDTGDPAGNLYVCRLKGITGKVSIAIAMTAVNATYDYVTCAITVTEVAA